MTVRRLEQAIILTIIAVVVVFFIFNLAQNVQILDLSVPVMVAALLVMWVLFRYPRK